VGIAAAIYAVRKERGGAKVLLAASGVLQSIVFAYLTYEFLSYPKVWGGNPLAYGYIAATFIVGALLYVIRKNRLRNEGLNISLTFKEIPPE
jgi:hypothetical protein